MLDINKLFIKDFCKPEQVVNGKLVYSFNVNKDDIKGISGVVAYIAINTFNIDIFIRQYVEEGVFKSHDNISISHNHNISYSIQTYVNKLYEDREDDIDF